MGSTLPRVTHILDAMGLGGDFSRVPPDVLEKARLRGSAVHSAIEAMVYGYFEECDAAIMPYLDAYNRFLAESKFVPTAAEFEVVHPAWRYCGHPDVIGWLGKARTLLDFKTGATEGMEYQLVAYVEAWNAQHPTETVKSAACVELRDSGTYRFNEVDLTAARPVWFAAVTVYHARQRRAA